jgi:hypothetical protein
MLPHGLGECYLAQWAEWRATRYAWQNGSSPSRDSNDAAGSGNPRVTLERDGEARRKKDGFGPPATRSGHVEPSSIRKHHAKTFETLASEATTTKPVRPFVLYTFRHTFLTRLGQCGCDAWTLARIAGHSAITISVRSSIRGCSAGCDGKTGWAQNWAQSGGPLSYPCEKCSKRSTLNRLQRRARSSAG